MATRKLVVDSPIGKIKNLAVMPDSYNRAEVEAHWDSWWQEQGFYSASASEALGKTDDEKFVMVIPPPNVTGSLHLGHALMCSIEDTLARWHRMNGKTVLWVPGVDHAGIATQVVVEKMLWKTEQLTRHDLGREKFVDKVWEWKEKYGGTICDQFRRLGCSVDWSREAFTMDDNLSHAVNEAFVRMHSNQKIYRANRLVNWSCSLRTAISNVEVEQIEIKKPEFLSVPGHQKSVEFGVIHSFAYKVIGSDSDEEIIVSTTRIETMLGDVAVAVHPEDSRYTKFHGKKLLHPFTDREVSIVLDPILVDMNFGTGAVKVTPAHDPNDFECGKRHDLKFINVLNEDGTINENGFQFEGQMRYDARKNVISELEKLGLFRGKSPNPMVLGRCSRSKDIVEPYLKPQWWVDCSEMASRATHAVRNGDLDIFPKSQEKTWFQWLDNIQDWCVSRQLWWGHRIPAYRILLDGVRASDDADMEFWVVAVSKDAAYEIAQSRFPDSKISLEQDEDVLDTWFSSGIFPFSVFGWPNNSDALRAFYPNSILETGHDILFFWVARMVMMGLELTNTLPFKQILLHPMVRDRYGRKMSKALGNVIDPIAVIEGISLEELHQTLSSGNLPEHEVEKAKKGQKKDYPDGIPECGADALRFGLLDYLVQERNINLDVARVLGYRQFCNKLWNASKFCFSLFEAADLTRSMAAPSFIDLWILSRLHHTIQECNTGFTEFQFSRCTGAIYSFFVKEFCAVYLETVKPVVLSESDSGEKTRHLNVLKECLETCLKLLHPIMPFVTEDLYQRFPGRIEGQSVMVASYPNYDSSLINNEIDIQMCTTLDVLHMVHSTREGLDIPKSSRPSIFVKCLTEECRNAVQRGIDTISSIAKLSSVLVLKENDPIPAGCVSSVVNDNIVIYVYVEGHINCSNQILKLQKRLEKAEKWIQSKQKTISQTKYIEKTPELTKEKHLADLNAKMSERDKLLSSIHELEAIDSQ